MHARIQQVQSVGKSHVFPVSAGERDALLQFAPEALAPDWPEERAEERAPAERPARGERGFWLVAAVAIVGIGVVLVMLLNMGADPQPQPQQTTVTETPPTETPPAPSVESPAPVKTSSNGRSSAASVVPPAKKPVARTSGASRAPAADASTASSRNASAGSPLFYGTLVIESVPSNARVFINGQAVGVTPLVLLEAPVGSRAIRLEADGHAAFSSTIRVVANQQARLTALLRPAQTQSATDKSATDR